ncbi:MAG: hypothetical protein IID44_04990 [Planctomycetes bacterium]|nr:hypothetical protein [Planctomycetota bacterium]
MSSEFRHGFLRGKSRRSESVPDLARGEFDYALFSSSWDKRCLSVTCATELRAANCSVVIPDLRDVSGLMDKHDPLLLQFASKIGKCKELRGDSRDVDGLWNQLLQHVLDVHRELARPLRIFIDLSTCPRFLSLGLLSQAVLSGIASEVTVFYSEGDYPEEESEEDQHELFTAGGWDAVPVPGLEGEWDPDKKRAYLVSVGFEGSKTLRLVSRKEPDEVSLLFPDPGVKPEYVDRTRKRNAPLIKRFRIPDDRIIRSDAGDAIEAWKRLEEASIERPDEQNVYYVCCGTKPHSLALALRALTLRYPALLYIVPDRHRVVDVDALGVFWRFDLVDMSSLEAYDHLD